MEKKFIYLDHNATTPVDPEVLEAMTPFFSEFYGNAASNSHPMGWQAEGAVDAARTQVADFIGAQKEEIVFTSGSTESCNLALKGVFEKYHAKGSHIITVATEHKAVLDTCRYLETKGANVTYLPVTPEGLIQLEDLRAAINKKTILVAVMLANNETGVIQPLKEISKIVHEAGSILFCDATQAAGKMSVDVNDLGVDMLCISAHKFYGPKGVGALYVRRKNPRVSLEALVHGGGHERDLRSGTLNVPGIVALGKACQIANAQLWDNNTHVSVLRAAIEHQLLDIPGVRINGSTKFRLYNTANICFTGRSAASIISKINNRVCVSAGSACSSALAQPSHVLKAMSLPEEDAYASIRFSVGKNNTRDEIEETIELIKAAL